jgi:CYTH domain-containing protein
MAVKLPRSRLNLIRKEYEFDINERIYNFLLRFKRGETIKKTRYSIGDGEKLHEFDVFHEQLTGLHYLEIEFPSEAEANQFTPPDYVIKEVTEIPAYKNANLAKNGMPKN